MANNPEMELGETHAKVLKLDKALLKALKDERKKRALPSISSVIRVLLREALARA